MVDRRCPSAGLALWQGTDHVVLVSASVIEPDAVIKFIYQPVSKTLIMLQLAGSKPLSTGTCLAFEDLLLCIVSYVMSIKNSRNRHLSMSSLLTRDHSPFPFVPSQLYF